MKKNLGIFILLTLIVAFMAFKVPESFLTPSNVANTTRWTSLYAILGIGVAFVIITGGIDLSVGSVVGLVGCLMVSLLVNKQWPSGIAIPVVLTISASLGLIHGILITKLKIKPFIVTLCGLLIYRGMGRWLLDDRQGGFGSTYDDGLRLLAIKKIPLVGDYFLYSSVFVMLAVAVLSAIFLNRTIYGRYLMALGRNEQAARFSGINTDGMTILAYVICSLLAGICGVLYSLEINTVAPAGHGNALELYAIAAAVLGGCSLRGGEGSVLGVVIGSAIIRVIFNAINLLKIPSTLDFVVLGGVILLGTIVDEIVRNLSARRRAALAAQTATS